MFAFVGLGNPGPRYASTRHNLGFMVVDEVAKRWDLQFRSGRGEYLQAVHRSKDAGLFKPLTYMNNSGQALRAIFDWYKLTLDDIFVIADDLDLEFPVLRIRGSGSSGGHKGLDSIIKHLGSSEFKRMKMGISNPLKDLQPTESFVLSRFNSEEKTEVEGLIGKAADALEYFLREGLTASMNRYNRKVKTDPEMDQLEAE